jgi:hypothetical protein
MRVSGETRFNPIEAACPSFGRVFLWADDMKHEEFEAEKTRQLSALKEWERHQVAELTQHPGYSVTRSGCVISNRRMVKGKSSDRQQLARVLKPYRSGKYLQYLKVRLCLHGESRQICVHVLIAEAFIGARPVGHDVDHIDGNTMNNCASNLRYLPMQINRGQRHGR